MGFRVGSTAGATRTILCGSVPLSNHEIRVRYSVTAKPSLTISLEVLPASSHFDTATWVVF
jgi:hypothetical protein